MLQSKGLGNASKCAFEREILVFGRHRVKRMRHLSPLNRRIVHLAHVAKFRLTSLKIGVIIESKGQVLADGGRSSLRGQKRWERF
jgi:hypothetical protein